MLNEFELIRRYFMRPAHGAVLGVGDDAALVRVRRGMELVVSADMLVAGRHFFADADPEQLGHKALAVNLSDMAAMGATPRWATLALALPRADPRWLTPFAGGFLRLARRYRVDLLYVRPIRAIQALFRPDMRHEETVILAIEPFPADVPGSG